ncbi:MAG: hypothetical protein ABSG59_10155 [Verrucomicrobiota bacterium]|jgi:hypothetical protein
MTTQEIITAIKLIHDEVAVLKKQAEENQQNPSWLGVAKGALMTAVNQVEIHASHVEKPSPAGP